jgi:hypothetical protein
VAGAQCLRRPADLLVLLLSTIVIWLMETVKYWLIWHGFTANPNFRELPFVDFMLFNGVANLSTVIPSGPGFVGTYEAAGVAVFSTIGIATRSARKPACISALTTRARVRAARSAGHSAGSISAQYSQIASVSQTRFPSCSRYGTRPLGDTAATAGVLPCRLSPSGITTSSTSSPAKRTASQPRIDQEE